MNLRSAPNRRFLFLLCSARLNGNTELLARRAAAVLGSDEPQEWLRLIDLQLEPFRDVRHDPDGSCPYPEGAARKLLEATLAASDLVFVAPLYWYGLPASAKLYLDHWSGWLHVPKLEFKTRMAGKTIWAISAFSDDDPQGAEPLFATLRLTASYMRMGWGGAILGRGSRPGDVLADAAALASADSLLAAIKSSQ